MKFINPSSLALALALSSVAVLAQENPKMPSPQSSPAAEKAKTSSSGGEVRKADHAASYYHFSMAHMYEEMMAMYGRAEYVSKAIEEYKLAIAADPSSEYLNASLAELYSRTGRIRDAVLEAQQIIHREPNNLEAHKLLGRIYLRSLRDTQSQEVFKLAIEQYEAIVRIEPGNPENYVLLGSLYESSDPQKAEKAFQQALKLEPASEEAVINLADLYNGENQTAKALEILNSIPESARSSKIYAAQGATYDKEKDYKNAVSSYQYALRLDKENLYAMHGLAESLANDNQLDAALNQYKALQAADPQNPQASLEIAKIYQRMGKFDLAMENLKKAAAEPNLQDSLEVPFNEALILEAQGKFDDAAAILQKLITRTTLPDGNYDKDQRRNRAVFLSRLGNIYRESGRPEQALETFRKMVDLGGEEAGRGYQDIIETYRDQKEWAEASRITQEAVKKLPDDKNLKVTLALQLADDGKADESIQLAKSLFKGEISSDRETYLVLSQIYMKLRRWKESEDALTEAGKQASKPEEKENVLFLQGALYEKQKKYDQAEQSFRQILETHPDSSPTLNYLGYILADHNMHLEEALAMIKRAVELEPQNGAYLDSLGWVYFKLGNYDQAEDYLRRAVEKTPNDATIQDHLGELYAKTGKLKLAAMHWERALDEWNRSIASEVDQLDVERVQKKLESTKVKLAQQHQ
jgi:tetratricopeptide (TPR) repeat protein